MVFPITLHTTISTFKGWQETIDLNQEYISYLSFREPELNNLKVASTYSSEETTEEQLTFNKKTLLRIREKLHSSIIGWEEENHYWVDENYFVWKSIQSVSPKLPPIFIEVTKKPR